MTNDVLQINTTINDLNGTELFVNDEENAIEDDLNANNSNNTVSLLLSEAGADQFNTSINSKTSVDEALLADMRYIYKNTRYFLIKSNNYENVNLAKAKV